jgi:ribulose-5-phosphate 4-epimerase/fuculose-1-phosphate aldolase
MKKRSASSKVGKRKAKPTKPSKEILKLLEALSIGHRVLEMEGHGDMALGHMSVRDPEGRGFWCKRKAAGLGEVVSIDDFVLQDMDGNKLWGEGEPHNEWPIHSEILRARSEINSIGHTHAFYGSVFSATDEKLLPVMQDGGRFWPGVPHDKSTAELVNTKELGLQLVNALGQAMAVFMKNHGVTFCGTTVQHCTLMGVWLERACKAQLLLASTGYKYAPLTDAEMKARLPQTYHSAFIDRSWDFYCRKLRWFDSLSPIGSEGTYRI